MEAAGNIWTGLDINCLDVGRHICYVSVRYLVLPNVAVLPACAPQLRFRPLSLAEWRKRQVVLGTKAQHGKAVMLKTMRFKETRGRSITKSITFRTLVICSDLVLVYILTHRVFDTVAITVATNVASTIFYFLHERLWNNISWGKQRVK